MKMFILCFLSLITFQSFAGEVVECSTNKGELKVIVTRTPYNKRKLENNVKIEILRVQDPLPTTFFGIKAEDTQTQLTNSTNLFIARADSTKKIDGGHSDSIMLNIERLNATLAWDGSVYLLNCGAKQEVKIQN
jgi:hypothetical protein